MIKDSFEQLYLKFRRNYCKNLFLCNSNNEEGLSAIESYCSEVIYLLKSPTIQEFSKFINISGPNATYRINNLIEKGYVKKIVSKEDKREYHLEVTEKFLDSYGANDNYQQNIIKKINEDFTKDEIILLDKLIQKIVSYDL
ncbi:MAG TPA: winged helix-turn-helix transcriptional regulator [Clostridiales bacterium]|nr:winged helix-turn-helix transcriptional regulator [Clostridiales bacterium]